MDPEIKFVAQLVTTILVAVASIAIAIGVGRYVDIKLDAMEPCPKAERAP